jgi:Ca-activated chloride channel family protein
VRPLLVLIACVACVAISAVAIGTAQSPPPVPQEGRPAPRVSAPLTTFRTATDLVALNVTVTDSTNRYLMGLAREDFAVYEDGVRQRIAFFAANAVPVDLSVLLDTSASMQDRLSFVQDAACGFVRTLGPRDRGEVVTFNNDVRIAHPFTADVAALEGAIRSTSAQGGTSLYNAVYIALQELTRAGGRDSEVRRQAIVLLTDGDDTASLLSFDDVLDRAKRAGVAIYPISIMSRYESKRLSDSGHSRFFTPADYALRTLARETGAQVFFPRALEELKGVYDEIARELSVQYSIGYSSSNPKFDGSFRRLVVRVPTNPEARLRTRSGYYAARPVRALLMEPGR